MNRYYLKINGNKIDIRKTFIRKDVIIPNKYDILNKLDELENLLIFVGMFKDKSNFIEITKEVLGITQINTMEIVDENNKVLLSNMIFYRDVNLLDTKVLNSFMEIYGGCSYSYNNQTKTIYNWLRDALLSRIKKEHDKLNLSDINEIEKLNLNELKDIKKIVCVFVDKYLPYNTSNIEEKIKILKTYKRIIQKLNINYKFDDSDEYKEKIDTMKRLFNEFSYIKFNGSNFDITQDEYIRRKENNEFIAGLNKFDLNRRRKLNKSTQDDDPNYDDPSYGYRSHNK